MTAPTTLSPRLARGFTLVELLVVIAIIAVLAAISVPAVSRGITQARKMEAKTDCVNLCSAMDAYRADSNGIYPDVDGGGSIYSSGIDDEGLALNGSSGDSALLVEALIGGDSMSTSAENLNKRQTQYLQIKTMNSSGKSGIDTNGSYSFIDFWGNAYQLFWDADYNDEVTNPLDSSGPAIKRGCIAISQGPADSLSDGMTGKDLIDVVTSW